MSVILFAVTVEVEQCQLCIQEIREEIHTKQGELAVKRNKLADQDVETKILQIRKEILTNQVDILFREKQKISDHVVSSDSILWEELLTEQSLPLNS